VRIEDGARMFTLKDGVGFALMRGYIILYIYITFMIAKNVEFPVPSWNSSEVHVVCEKPLLTSLKRTWIWICNFFFFTYLTLRVIDIQSIHNLLCINYLCVPLLLNPLIISIHAQSTAFKARETSYEYKYTIIVQRQCQPILKCLCPIPLSWTGEAIRFQLPMPNALVSH
jgi:hypothetical protein